METKKSLLIVEKYFKLIELAKTFNIEAQVIGRVEASAHKELVLAGSFGKEVFTY